jgi:uncharacterized repeat protein (TIGR02543 family)
VSTKSKKVTVAAKYGKLPTPKRSGYGFVGWYTKKSGGSKITATTKVTLKKTHTLYARWTKRIPVKQSALNGIGKKLGTLSAKDSKLKYISLQTFNTIPYKGEYVYKSYYSTGGTKFWYAIQSQVPFSNPEDLIENADEKISYVGGTVGTFVPDMKGSMTMSAFIKAIGAKKVKYYNDPVSDYAGVLVLKYDNKYRIQILCGVKEKFIRTGDIIEVHPL